jgi:hypothetical protein
MDLYSISNISLSDYAFWNADGAYTNQHKFALGCVIFGIFSVCIGIGFLINKLLGTFEWDNVTQKEDDKSLTGLFQNTTAQDPKKNAEIPKVNPPSVPTEVPSLKDGQKKFTVDDILQNKELSIEEVLNYALYFKRYSYKPYFRIMEKAAAMGHKEAMSEVGLVYINGNKKIGVEIDVLKGIDLLERSESFGTLARLYFEGKKLHRDFDKALSNAEKAFAMNKYVYIQNPDNSISYIYFDNLENFNKFLKERFTTKSKNS